MTSATGFRVPRSAGRRYAMAVLLAMVVTGLVLASVFVFSDWLVPSPEEAGRRAACQFERELRAQGQPPLMTGEEFARCPP